MSINPIFIFVINQLSYKIMAHQLVPTITKNYNPFPSPKYKTPHRNHASAGYVRIFGTNYRVWFKIKKGERHHVNPGLLNP
jgi:hypothetical protein